MKTARRAASLWAAILLGAWCAGAQEELAGAPAGGREEKTAPAGSRGEKAEPTEDGGSEVENPRRDLEHRLEAMRAERDAKIQELQRQIDALRSAAGAGTKPPKGAGDGERKPPARGAEAKRAAAGPSKGGEDAELKALLQSAEAAAAAGAEPEEAAGGEEETTFKLGGLSLQALNPEISVVGDMLGRFRYQGKARERLQFDFRTLDVHIQSYLDPYSKLKAVIPIDAGGAELEEAYMTRYGVLEGLNISAGRFRQQFGVVNRWHEHALDQIDYPLALQEIFGEEGLNQTGLSLDWTMPPLWGASQELVVEVTNGSNDRLFEGNTLSTPSSLVRYHNYRDLTKDTYLDWGVSALAGWNKSWDVLDTSTGQFRKRGRELSTRVFGADLTLLWEPTDRMRYRHLTWRTEGYFLNRDLLAPDDGSRDAIDAWGAYSYLEGKAARTWDLGLRFDFFMPDQKGYAALVPSWPVVNSTPGAHRWALSPYVTWHQSPFVQVRMEYDYLNGKGAGGPEHVVQFQLVFAAGPHKHERY